MPIRNAKQVDKLADLYATAHGSYVSGHSIAGAIAHVSERYPSLSANTIANIVRKIYDQRSTMDALFDSNLGRIVNLKEKMNCPSGRAVVTTYTTFRDEKTRFIKHFWQDVNVSDLTVYKNMSQFVLGLVEAGLLAAKLRNYKVPEKLYHLSARDWVQGFYRPPDMIKLQRNFTITGWKCV